MVNHSTTLIRAYSGALIYYLVPLELDHVDYTTNTTSIIIKVAKVDLTTGVQRTLLCQHIWKSIELTPIWLGEPIELTSTHQALDPL